MTTSETAAGTPVLHYSHAEWDAFLDGEVRRRMGMSRADFVGRYPAGGLDQSDPDVPFLAGLLRLSHNGHSEAA
jgi:hypothetical protein